MLMNYTLRFVLLILFIVYLIPAQDFNNRNFFVQSKFSNFSYLSDNNTTTNNNTNLIIDL